MSAGNTELAQHTRERLGFARYILTIAEQQCREPEPLCYSGLLGLHDALELFLALACERADAGGRDLKFLEYLGEFEKKTGIELSHRRSLARLNKARVSLKHDGTWPSKRHLDEFRFIATAFLEENCPKIFSVELSAISMVDLVACEAARGCLRKAEELLGEQDARGACTQASAALAHAMKSKEAVVREFGGAFWPSLSHLELRVPWEDSRPSPLEDFSRKVLDQLEKLQAGIAYVVSDLNVSDPDWRRFRALTPAMSIMMSGEARGTWTNWTKLDPTLPEASFCVEFSVRACLRLDRLGSAVD